MTKKLVTAQKYTRFNKELYSELINLINNGYRGPELKSILQDFTLVNSSRKADIITDNYTMPDSVPLVILTVTYDTKEIAFIKLRIGFYLNMAFKFIWTKIAHKRLNQIFKKQLENILEETFKKRTSADSVEYWDSGITALKKKKVLNEKKDWIYIYIDYARKEIFPSESEFNIWLGQ